MENANFRELEKDYELCFSLLWECHVDPQANRGLIEEYLTLIQELEIEILQFLHSTHQNKGGAWEWSNRLLWKRRGRKYADRVADGEYKGAKMHVIRLLYLLSREGLWTSWWGIRNRGYRKKAPGRRKRAERDRYCALSCAPPIWFFISQTWLGMVSKGLT